MPPLRRRLNWRAGLTLTGLLLIAALVLDLSRAPQSQWLAAGYVGLVRAYQRHGHTLTAGWIACRYQPTCSRYSVEAVERHGLARGLTLTIRRIASCQATVPAGTPDPVP